MPREDLVIKSQGHRTAGLQQEAYDTMREFSQSLGADLFGVASAEGYSREFPDKPSPFSFVRDAKSIIMIGMAFLKGTMDTVLRPQLSNLKGTAEEQVSGGVRPQGAERYFFGEENKLLLQETEWIGYRIARRLEQDGYSAFYFPAYKQDPRHRTALFYMTPGLHMAGMGTLGLNCCVITPEYGPRVFINAIITNLELPTGMPLKKEICTHCGDCVKACPSGALDGVGWKNIYRCAAYGCCGTCLAICPVGR